MQLTKREAQVLELVLAGRSSKEAARALGGISPRTIECHRLTLLRKFGVRNSVELVRTVIE